MKWENKIICIDWVGIYYFYNNSKYPSLEDILNELGRERWELVTVNSRNQYFFKREIIR